MNLDTLFGVVMIAYVIPWAIWAARKPDVVDTDTPEGKRFFAVFLDHCGVVNPRFARDPQEIVWNESRRHLAMSYLKLLAQDDAEAATRRPAGSRWNITKPCSPTWRRTVVTPSPGLPAICSESSYWSDQNHGTAM